MNGTSIVLGMVIGETLGLAVGAATGLDEAAMPRVSRGVIDSRHTKLVFKTF
jgi:uncharacterized protein (DUF2236 family)